MHTTKRNGVTTIRVYEPFKQRLRDAYKRLARTDKKAVRIAFCKRFLIADSTLLNKLSGIYTVYETEAKYLEDLAEDISSGRKMIAADGTITQALAA